MIAVISRLIRWGYNQALTEIIGEKTNPLPMEMYCQASILIECIAVVGHRRPITAAVVQLNRSEALRYTEQERKAIVLESIKGANAVAPKHSRIIEEMVFILPLNSVERIPRTPKGILTS